MDTNLLSCSKCGHIVSETAESCAYCGTAISSDDSVAPSGEGAPEIAEQAAQEAPLPMDNSSEGLAMTEESAGKPDAAEVTADAGNSDQIQPDENRAEITEPAVEVAADAGDQSPDSDGSVDFQLPDDELIVEMETEEAVQDPAGEDSKITAPGELELSPGQADTVDSEQQAAGANADVIPLADKVSAKAPSDDSAGLPKTPVLEEGGDDTLESETLGADILELVQADASGQESAEETASDAAKSGDKTAGEKKAEPASGETPGGSETRDGEQEAILLSPDDTAQPANQPSAGDGEKNLKTDDHKDPAGPEVTPGKTGGLAATEALKTEKASQNKAEAQKKQKAVADAKALKKQKAALVKAKALKIKKLKLAKAQALKKKKLQLAKAQALKKQKAAQAAIAAANTEVAAGSKSRDADNPNTVIKSMDTNTKMLGLLKKYEGQAIGINYDNSADIKEAQLVEANNEFFSVFVKEKELSYNHPLKTVLTIIEGQDGVETGESDQKTKFKAVVKVYPLVLF
ncbi:MAG: hypothetical protein P8X85_02005 [Desulfobacterales bacterium]